MPTIMSSREFNQDTSRAKRAAIEGPVMVTDRGRPSHVLLSMEHYLALTGGAMGIVEMLAMPEAEHVEFEPPRLGELSRPAELS